MISGWLLIVSEHRGATLMLLMRRQRSEGRVEVVGAAGDGNGGRRDAGRISSGGRRLQQPLHGERAVLRGRGCGRQRLRFAR